MGSEETIDRPSLEQSPPTTSLLRLPLAVMLGAIVLYSGTLSKHYSEGEDGAHYVLQVTSPSTMRDLFHPNHLAYNSLNRLIYLACRRAGYTGNACLPMQAVNVLAGALTLGLMVRILRRLDVDDRLALCWAAVTAACFGFWSYSTQPETYILPLLPILICIDLLVGLWDDRFSYRTFAWLGCFAAISVLLHQQHVLVLSATGMAAAIIGYRCRSEVPLRRTVVGLAIYGFVAAAIVGTAYLTVAIGVLGLRDPEAIIRWSKGHAKNGLWVPWSYSNPIQSLVAGFPRAVFGGHFLYAFDWFYNPIARRFPGKLLVEERYLAQQLPSWVRLTCLATTVVALAAAAAVAGTLWFPVSAEPASPDQKRRSQAANTIALLLIFHYYAFNTAWEPYNIEFWIVLLPVSAIAMALQQAHRPRARRFWFTTAALAASLFVVNGLGSILPQTRHDTDFWYQANRYLIDHARAGDVIVTDGAFISDMSLRVLTGADVVPARLNAETRLPQILLDSGPHRVWITSWAIDPPQVVRKTGLLAATDEKALQRSFQAVGDRMIKRDEGPFQTVWELTPPTR